MRSTTAMDTTHCITNPTWELYAANKLGAKELAAIQKHAATCELCSDIKAGIDAMPNPALLSEEVNTLNQQVDEYLAPKKTKKIPLWYWSAAAVLLISLGIGWMYSSTAPKENVAVKSTPQPQAAEIDTPSPAKTENEQQTPQENPKQKNTLYKKENTYEIPGEEKRDETLITDEKFEKDINTESKTLDFLNNRLNTETNANKDELAEDDLNVVVLPPIDTLSRLNRSTISSTKIDLTKRKKESTLPTATMNNYFNNSHFELNNFSWADVNRTADSISYTNAKTYFDNTKYDSCITTLNNIVDKSSAYYQQALLLKAKTYIKQNKNEEAKSHLKALISLNGTLKKEAKQLLKTIK